MGGAGSDERLQGGLGPGARIHYSTDRRAAGRPGRQMDVPGKRLVAGGGVREHLTVPLFPLLSVLRLGPDT